MRVRRRNPRERPVPGGRAHAQLRQQMPPFVLELSARLDQPPRRAARAQFPAVEAVAAALGLGVNAGQIGIDRGDRIGMGAEAHELRVAAVAARAALEHPPGEQRFAPERDQPARVEVAGMNGPEPHDGGSRRIGGARGATIPGRPDRLARQRLGIVPELGRRQRFDRRPDAIDDRPEVRRPAGRRPLELFERGLAWRKKEKPEDRSSGFLQLAGSTGLEPVELRFRKLLMVRRFWSKLFHFLVVSSRSAVLSSPRQITRIDPGLGDILETALAPPSRAGRTSRRTARRRGART